MRAEGWSRAGLLHTRLVLPALTRHLLCSEIPINRESGGEDRQNASGAAAYECGP